MRIRLFSANQSCVALYLLVLAGLVASPCIAGLPPGPGFNKPPTVLAHNTSLTIELYGKDLLGVGPKLEISAPRKIRFPWKTQLRGKFVARWKVSDNFAPGNQFMAGQPHVVASGSISSLNSSGFFDVDFTKFLVAPPVSSLHTYYIWLAPEPGAPLAVSSNTVRVIYGPPLPQPDMTAAREEQEKVWSDPTPTPIYIDLAHFTCVRPDDSNGDEPYLIVVAVYADGTTINLGALASSSARIDSRPATHGDLIDADNYFEAGTNIIVPPFTGHYETTVLPINAWGTPFFFDLLENPGHPLTTNSIVGLLIVALEEDATTDVAIEHARQALVAELQTQVNAAVRSGTAPNIQAITDAIKAKVTKVLTGEALGELWKPWGILQVVDADDLIGTATVIVNLQQIWDAGPGGIPFTTEFSQVGVHYRVTGTIGYRSPLAMFH